MQVPLWAAVGGLMSSRSGLGWLVSNFPYSLLTESACKIRGKCYWLFCSYKQAFYFNESAFCLICVSWGGWWILAIMKTKPMVICKDCFIRSICVLYYSFAWSVGIVFSWEVALEECELLTHWKIEHVLAKLWGFLLCFHNSNFSEWKWSLFAFSERITFTAIDKEWIFLLEKVVLHLIYFYSTHYSSFPLFFSPE